MLSTELQEVMTMIENHCAQRVVISRLAIVVEKLQKQEQRLHAAESVCYHVSSLTWDEDDTPIEKYALGKMLARWTQSKAEYPQIPSGSSSGEPNAAS